jgi:filamentous hemagglutinin
VTCNGADVYVIPRPNSGWAAGAGGQGGNLNDVTIITRPGTNQLITAWPGSYPQGNFYGMYGK